MARETDKIRLKWTSGDWMKGSDLNSEVRLETCKEIVAGEVGYRLVLGAVQ